jgi:hypothetical protein
MQSSAPELIDLSGESDTTLRLYGVEKDKPSFARNCLLARLVERSVRSCSYHTNWDSHGGQGESRRRFREGLRGGQGRAALVKDLKARGLLKDTLVIWGGEFGRTPMGKTATPPGVIITSTRLRCGSPTAGESRRGHGRTDELGWCKARTFTTCTPPSCTCSAWITKGSLSVFRAGTSGLRTCTANSSRISSSSPGPVCRDHSSMVAKATSA